MNKKRMIVLGDTLSNKFMKEKIKKVKVISKIKIIKIYG